MSSTSTKLVTADELLKMGDIGRCELIYGELIKMSPAGFDHGIVAARMARFLGEFVEQNDLGAVLGAETGFKLESDPDLVRAPDAAFVRKNRIPAGGWQKYFPGAPDLAVEVLSPDDTKREAAEKINMWLVHGATSCWVTDPKTMTVTIYRAAAPAIRLTATDEIIGEPALPGFVLPIARIFKRP